MPAQFTAIRSGRRRRRPVDGGLDLRRVGDVGGDVASTPSTPVRLDVAWQVQGEDGGALRRQCRGGRLAQAGGPTGDDRGGRGDLHGAPRYGDGRPDQRRHESPTVGCGVWTRPRAKSGSGPKPLISRGSARRLGRASNTCVQAGNVGRLTKFPSGRHTPLVRPMPWEGHPERAPARQLKWRTFPPKVAGRDLWSGRTEVTRLERVRWATAGRAPLLREGPPWLACLPPIGATSWWTLPSP